eukprot:TRINITY_DN379_c0_g1_i1.p1 TRINITY_DN379_c0_g1~~TRINITY_DN379_c0_g1_i1.p1  ORF type:complete len:516 (+),score=99.64 TRINITY_DN379_c0_g1_i1:479-2026(+)
MGSAESRQGADAHALAAGIMMGPTPGSVTTTVTHFNDGRAAITYPVQDPKGRQYYEGTFIDGKRTGRGLLRWRNGVVYEGDWEDDNMHGAWGRMTWPEGLVYEGQWSNGQMEGVGIMRRIQSTLNKKKKSTYAYQGEWKNGRRHGLGKQLFEEGDTEGRVSFEGEWQDGLRQGKGMMLWRDGSFYTGDWAKGVREGFGIFVDMGREGERYEGQWHKDMREDDEGMVIDRFGNQYKGAFVKDVKHGQGVLTFAHGRVRCETWAWGQRTPDSFTHSSSGTTLPSPRLVVNTGSGIDNTGAPQAISPEPSATSVAGRKYEVLPLVVLCLENLGRSKQLRRQVGIRDSDGSHSNSNIIGNGGMATKGASATTTNPEGHNPGRRRSATAISLVTSLLSRSSSRKHHRHSNSVTNNNNTQPTPSSFSSNPASAPMFGHNGEVKSMCIALTMLQNQRQSSHSSTYQQQHQHQQQQSQSFGHLHLHQRRKQEASSEPKIVLLPQELLCKVHSFVGSLEAGLVD